MTVIFSLIPIVNNQQKIMAVMPSFQLESEVNCFSILQKLKDNMYFEMIPRLPLYLPVSDINTIPLNLPDTVPVNSIILSIDEHCCKGKEAETKLKFLEEQDLRICMDEFTSKSSLIWAETKAIAINCIDGIPTFSKEWLLKLNNHPHLAKNLSTKVQLQSALDAGFTLFYGDYPFVEEENKKNNDPTSRTRLLKLLGLVSRDADSTEIEALFKQDPQLSYMLLKIVSTAAFAQTTNVTSFKQAITLLGRRQLQRWLQLLLYANSQTQGGALNPLMLRAAFRASMMENICKLQGGNTDEQDCAFMVGMFSLLDVLFSADLVEILKPLLLNIEVVDALLNRSGKLGAHLELVSMSDRKYSNELNSKFQQADIEIEEFYNSIIQAYTWVNKLSQEI